MAMVDVDNLRQLNAGGGHAQGDQVLRRVAQELEAVLQADDLGGPMGGDEFLVVCQASEADMFSLMEQLRWELAASRQPEERIGISVGVAEVQTDESLDSCIARADAAL